MLLGDLEDEAPGDTGPVPLWLLRLLCSPFDLHPITSWAERRHPDALLKVSPGQSQENLGVLARAAADNQDRLPRFGLSPGASPTVASGAAQRCEVGPPALHVPWETERGPFPLPGNSLQPPPSAPSTDRGLGPQLSP